MTTALITGSERLAQSLKDEGLPVDMTDCWAEFIKADPGIKALVSLAELVRDGKAARVDGDATLDKWETGT